MKVRRRTNPQPAAVFQLLNSELSVRRWAFDVFFLLISSQHLNPLPCYLP
jgi:hypothetical protein